MYHKLAGISCNCLKINQIRDRNQSEDVELMNWVLLVISCDTSRRGVTNTQRISDSPLILDQPLFVCLSQTNNDDHIFFFNYININNFAQISIAPKTNNRMVKIAMIALN